MPRLSPLRTWTAALGLAILPAPSLADGSFRCDGGIVSVGDSKLDLVGKCGWPTLQEVVGEGTTVVRERWGDVTSKRVVTA